MSLPRWRKTLKALSWDPDRWYEGLKGLGLTRVMRNQLLKPYTTYEIGGPADLFVEVQDLDELCRLLPFLKENEIPYFVLGGGSNLLIQDGGYRGVVLRLSPNFRKVEIHPGDVAYEVNLGAALPLGALIRLAREYGWGEVAPIAGTPGTIGGGLRMNAGNAQVGLGDFLIQATVVTSEGRVVEIPRERLRYSYRKSHYPPGSVIVEGKFRFQREDLSIARKKLDDFIRYRRETQPLTYPSAGSVFRNPPEIPAAKVIEQLGLKGIRLHGAEISTKHANFIVNLGGAEARDVLALIRLCKNLASRELGIALVEEIEILGTPSLPKEFSS
jgi:UDP-N-acetylmuramate dehydrogenase